MAPAQYGGHVCTASLNLVHTTPAGTPGEVLDTIFAAHGVMPISTSRPSLHHRTLPLDTYWSQHGMASVASLNALMSQRTRLPRGMGLPPYQRLSNRHSPILPGVNSPVCACARYCVRERIPQTCPFAIHFANVPQHPTQSSHH